jgi:DnaK suppressor protein
MIAEITESELVELRDRLLSQQKELLRKVGNKDRIETVDLELPIGRLSRVDALQQQSMAKAEIRRAKQSLEQIESALEFMEAGTYGFCKMCEEPIGYRRLNARPSSPFCIDCIRGVQG